MSSKYCWFCFSPKGSARACPFCGALEGGRNREDQLQSGMELIDRYVVGGASDGGNNGVIYLAVDLQDAGRLVRIKEFIPKEYARRSDLNYDIVTDQLDAIRFSQRKNNILNQANELIKSGRYSNVFEANNTVYVVSPLKRTDTPVQELPEVKESEQQIGYVPEAAPSYRPECRPVPDTPEYVPPAAPAEEAPEQQFVFEETEQTYPTYEAEPAVRDFSSFVSDDPEPYSEETTELDYEYEDNSFFDKLIVTLKFLFSRLGAWVDSVFDKLAESNITYNSLRFFDQLFKKDTTFESNAQYHERAKKFSIGAVVTLFLIIVLIFVLVTVL